MLTIKRTIKILPYSIKIKARKKEGYTTITLFNNTTGEVIFCPTIQTAINYLQDLELSLAV